MNLFVHDPRRQDPPAKVVSRRNLYENATYQPAAGIQHGTDISACRGSLCIAAETGDTFNFNGLTYEITSDTTAKVKGPEATTLLTQVTIPEKATNSLNGESYTVTAIADKAFRNTKFNGEITSITLPDSLKEIGDFAFFSCFKLEDINLPDGLTKIGYQAFQNCYSLTEITIPSSVTTMGSHVFNRCTGLKEVTFEKNSQLSALPDATFANCISLESFTLPNGFASIGKNAFYKCGKLTTLNISDDVTEIKKMLLLIAQNSTLSIMTVPNTLGTLY